jgi:hypothetical protein
MRLIQQLDEEDKQTIFRMIEKMLTKKKFKDFFQKNVTALLYKTWNDLGFVFLSHSQAQPGAICGRR